MITVIGAGPAGLTAALAAAESGAEVLLIDSGSRLGGQFWRHLPAEPQGGMQGNLNFQFLEGAELRRQVLENSQIKILLNSHVWAGAHFDDSTTLQVLTAGVNQEIKTQTLILATGAYDRTLPFPGWDIPGVMTPGGVQALLKSSGVVAGEQIVVAGTGPFLLPVAAGLAEAGAEIVALLDANRFFRWIPHLHSAMANLTKLKEGAGYFRTLRKFGVKQKRGYAIVAAKAGDDGTLSSVEVAKVDRNFKMGKSFEITCDCLAVGWGFTADLSLAINLGLATEVVPEDQGLVLTVDKFQESSINGIFGAGEITGIGGSRLSLSEGRIAGLAAAARENQITQAQLHQLLAGLIPQRSREKKFGSALLAAYPIGNGWRKWLCLDTVICRCEEVTFGEINSAIYELGAQDARTVKLFTRTGMGLCQGRVCARTVLDLVGNETQIISTQKDHQAANKRAIIFPISMNEFSLVKRIE